MKKLIIVLMLLSSATVVAQKIKMKKGTVYVDKKPFLTYKGDVFYTFDGVKLFSITKESILVDANSNDEYDQVVTQSRRNTSDAQQMVSASTLPKKKKFMLVKFAMFDLEFETNITKTKILREFYRNQLVNSKGLIDENKALELAKIRHQNISGSRERL